MPPDAKRPGDSGWDGALTMAGSMLGNSGHPAGADGFAVPVHRQADGAQVGAVAWPQARFEPARDALLQLSTFLEDQHLLADECPPRTGLLH